MGPLKLGGVAATPGPSPAEAGEGRRYQTRFASGLPSPVTTGEGPGLGVPCSTLPARRRWGRDRRRDVGDTAGERARNRLHQLVHRPAATFVDAARDVARAVARGLP